MSQPADQATIDAAHAAYLRALRERNAAAAALNWLAEHDGYGIERADERRTDAAYDLAETGEALLSALGYGLPAEPADAEHVHEPADRHADVTGCIGCDATLTWVGPGHDDYAPEDDDEDPDGADTVPESYVWNQHTNDLGDHCPHSGEPTDDDPDDDGAACPAGCRSSYPTTDED